MLHHMEEIGELGSQTERGATGVVEESSSGSRAQDRQIDDIDLRGLVCSAIHEYRVSEMRAELTFVDEHPYAIIKGDRAAVIAMVRTFFDFAIQESCGQRLTVRLYSIGEELYVEVTGEMERAEVAGSFSSKENRQSARLESPRRHRLGLSKGWLRFGPSTEGGVMLAMSFRSS